MPFGPLFFVSLIGFKPFSHRISERHFTLVQPDSLKQVGEWSPFFTQQMDAVWIPLKLKGWNYYSMGLPGPGKTYMQRSDYKSKYYQAWFGTYVIDAKDQLFIFPNDEINLHNPVITQSVLMIGEQEQSSWLEAMGYSDPYHSTHTLASKKYTIIDRLFIQGKIIPVFEWSMSSRSDLSTSLTNFKWNWDLLVLLYTIYGNP